MLPVFNVLEQHFDVYCYKHLCALFLVQHVHYQKLLILHSSFLLSGSITTFVTVPIAPFVNPSVTSIFVVIITLALIFIVKNFHRLPVSCGLVGIVTFASSVQSSFLLSVAIFVNSFPGSNLSLFSFHTSQCTFCAYTCTASCG